MVLQLPRKKAYGKVMLGKLLSLLLSKNGIWISYVRDAAIKPKSLWKSYALDSVRYGQREQQLMERLCLLLSNRKAYGKVMLLQLPHKKANGKVIFGMLLSML